MAQLAIEAAHDDAIEGREPEDLVLRLYGSLHKTKRSYIRTFVHLLNLLGDDLQFPKAVARDLGVEVARVLREHPERVGPLRRELAVCADAEGQGVALRALVLRKDMPVAQSQPERADTRQKYEFHIGSAKITARRGEFRIKDDTDFTDISRDRLEAAVEAFKAALQRS
jgi:ParB family chromosome partitioning protein